MTIFGPAFAGAWHHREYEPFHLPGLRRTARGVRPWRRGRRGGPHRRALPWRGAAGLPLCTRVEATIVGIAPDGGPNAAYFPPLAAADWKHEVMEEVAAEGDVPAYRYERFTRKVPVTV